MKPNDDDRFTEADIVTILRAGAAGTLPDELCAAEGIALKTYETWKAKYSGLSASQIRVRRRRERTSRRTTVAFAALVVVATGGWYAFTHALPAPATVAAVRPQPKAATPARGAAAPAAAAASSAVTSKPTAPSPASAAPAPATTAAAKKASVPAAPVPTSPPAHAKPAAAARPEPNPVPADATPARGAAEGHGYSVQIAAVPSADLARSLIVDLTKAGYPAYVTRTTVDGTVLYRVRVGPFESREATKAIAGRLETAGFRGVWLVPK